MGEGWLIDREALRAELGQVFDLQTTEVLLEILERVATQVRAAGVPREDFQELRAMERARKHLVGEIFPVIFGYRMRPKVRRAVEEAGIRIVLSFGQWV